ncbi:hypothetical protein JCM33374_g4061 [Metschnikowia sp. JCM 33374]|nr:hypothetical protein JCM33374_g4061 [Metschnikowia sp. JCM 33374]
MIFLWLFYATLALAVYIGLPMNEQLPNVARVGEPYSFTLAGSTYKSSAGGSITYSAANLPNWLSFDASSRTFYGTPSASDVSTFQVSLTGHDSADNSNYTASYSMLVSNNSGVALSSSDVMFTQIARYGKTNGVDGLSVTQGQNFSIQFSPSVFKLNPGSTLPIVGYYGRSGDRTSLPSWVKFNPNTLTFSGQVPYVVSDIAPSIDYTFAFLASDYAGYAGAEGIFKLIVGAHQLSTSLNETIKINGTYGSSFDYPVPILSDVYLDDSLISRANISSVTTPNMPGYVSFDQQSYALTGTFPNASSFQNFSVVVSDLYGNSVSLPYSFDSMDSVFTITQLSDVNATRGEYFSYQLLRSYFTDYADTKIAVSFANDSSWLSFHDSNMTINGEVPTSLASVKVTVEASSDYGKDSRSFNIVGVDKIETQSSSSSSSFSSLTSLSAPSSGAPVGAATATASATATSTLVPSSGATGNDLHSEVSGPGFGRIDTNDDHDETAVQLAAINALKLDEDDDEKSTTSTLTHVDLNEERFAEGSEKPTVSWRANETSDSSAMKKILLRERHASEMSLTTISTEQLFSVRLVDENQSARNSNQSALRKSADLPTVMRDDSAENIQKLDSDGNLVDKNAAPATSAKIRGSATQNSLHNISEEDTNSTFFTQESSDYNLLAKFLGSQQGSENSSIDVKKAKDTRTESQPTIDLNGEENWGAVSEGQLLPSPDAESFLLGQQSSGQNRVSFLDDHVGAAARASVYSDFSFGEGAGDDGKRGSKVKLVNFTRKASLRDSSREQYVHHPGDAAQIINDSD